MKKKIVACISFLILIIIMVLIIMCFRQETTSRDNSKISIVATLFPQYDLAQKVAGDKANVKLLLESGVETHNYEPTAKDMITIVNNTDMFIYTGTKLEPWTEKIIDSLENAKVVDVSAGIDLIKIEEFEERHINSEIINDEHSEEHSHHEEEIYDAHIWMSPKNAIIMIDNITKSLCELDKENEDYYRENAEKYKNEILDLDNELKNILDESDRKEIAIGGEFAYSYLVDEYDLNFVTVYSNCGDGEDPSIAKVKSVIDYINKYKLPVVYYEELSEGTVAKMIAEETDAEPLVLYSIHNGTPGIDSYVSLMRSNLENLQKGLKDN